MNYPTKVRIKDEEYPINTDFRIAIECNSIAKNEDIGDYERALAVIYKLFGEKGLKDEKNHCELLELAQQYLSMGKEIVEDVTDHKSTEDVRQEVHAAKGTLEFDLGIQAEGHQKTQDVDEDGREECQFDREQVRFHRYYGLFQAFFPGQL